MRGHGAGGIEGLAATGSEDGGCAGRLSRGGDAGDLGAGAFAGEGVDGISEPGLSEGFLPGALKQGTGRATGDDEDRATQTQARHLGTEGRGGMRALCIAGGGTKDGVHCAIAKTNRFWARSKKASGRRVSRKDAETRRDGWSMEVSHIPQSRD